MKLFFQIKSLNILKHIFRSGYMIDMLLGGVLGKIVYFVNRLFPTPYTFLKKKYLVVVKHVGWGDQI